MPDRDEHIDHAHMYLCAYFELAKSDCVPVRGTLLFYSTMHLVEAAAGNDDIHNEIHFERKRWIKECHPGIHYQYMELDKLGRFGRYYPNRMANIDAEKMDVTFFNKHYKKIVYWLATQLEDPALIDKFLPTPAAT